MKPTSFTTRLACLLVASCLGATPLIAQGVTSGGIRAQVTSSGEPVANAEVTVTNEETGLTRTAVTDRRGRAVVPLLPPGRYSLTVRLLGFRQLGARGVDVTVGEIQTVSFALERAPVALEALTVVGEAAPIDVTQGGVVQTISTDQLDNLPALGRDFVDFLNLSPLVSPQPGVTTGGQFSIGGARVSGTNVRIDGVDANNIFFAENRGSARTPFTFSLESIKEFQLLTNGFDVEYGNYQGGVVNVVTRGGTNTYRGTAHLFFRDEQLTRDDFAGNEPVDFRVYQFGGSLSGPILPDKLHFFLSADAQIKDQPIFAADPAASGIAADSLARFLTILETVHGFQNPQRFFGKHNQDEDNLVLFGRLDWSLNQNHRATLRVNYSDFEQTNDRISLEEAISHGGPFRDEQFSTVVELNSTFGTNASNTFRFQFSDEDRPRPFEAEAGFLPEIEVQRMAPTGFRIVEFGGDGIVFRNRLEENKLEFIDNFSYRVGDHTFKLGTANIVFNTTNTFWLLGNGEYRFNNLADFAANRPSRYFRLTRACPVPLVNNAAGQPVICPEFDVPFAEFTALEWSLYAQDAWQVTDRLLVQAGMRVTGTTFTDEPGRVAAVEQAFGFRTDEVPGFTGISPRFSFTYDVRGNQRQIVRGGIGVLQGRAPTVLAGNVFQTDKPLLSVFCTGGSVPAFDLDELLADRTGQNNPAACSGGQAPSGRPEHSVFSEDFRLPRTVKANLGYEHLLPTGTKLAVDFLFSVSKHLFTVQDVNLKDPQFTLGAEGRPVLVPAVEFDPRFGAGSERLRDGNFDNIFVNVTEGEARAFNFTIEVDQRIGDALQVSGRYAHTRAFDNSSFSCCTSGEGFAGEPTAGDPNFVGDFGEDERGLWGPSRFERRHTFVTNFSWRGPAGVRVNGIWRLQSGTPWTPLVDGDVNGDGEDDNDRAFVGTNLEFETAADLQAMQALLDEHGCLADQLGRIATRNSCRNPWFNSLDLRLSWEVPTVRGQRVEVLLDLFNLLNGINSDWGRFRGVFGSDRNLLAAEGFNPVTGNVIYSVNRAVDPESGEITGFGDKRQVGFDPIQFQAQLGVRYRF